jgi:2-polyprenyl-3-methyl-5-hydroxy-6-metoxy-1,4-benzoquinol methylase
MVLEGARDFIWRKPGLFTICQCKSCGLVATRPRPSDAALNFYYEGTYSGENDASMEAYQKDSWPGRLISAYRLAVMRRVRPLNSSDRLLDVGCSYGAFLSAARSDSGCSTTGVDFDEGSIARAMDPELTRYHTGHITDPVFADGQFSVVTFFESLEHHTQPVEALREAHRILEPGGLCVVEVPNFAGFWRRLFGIYWLPLLMPQHLFHFTPASLAKTFKAAGFSRVLHHQTMFYPLEGVASLAIWLSKVFRSPPWGTPPSWRTPFDILMFLVICVLYPVLEIPTQLILRMAGATGHQLAIAIREESTSAGEAVIEEESPV